MIFKNFLIKNFRGIKEVEISDLSRINLFLGKNNSGKSSILEAMFLLLSPGNPQLIVSIDNARNIIHDEPNDFRFAFYQLNYDNAIQIASELFVRDGKRELKITPIRETSDTTNSTVQRSLSTAGPNASALDSRTHEIVNGLQFSTKNKQYQHPKEDYKTTIKIAQGSNGIQFQVSPTQNITKNAIVGLLQGSATKGAFDLTQRLNTIVVEKKKVELIEALKGIDNRIVDFELGTKNMIYFDIGIQRLIPANLMGDGILKLLNFYVNIYSARNGCLMIDELDNGMHFETMKVLWKFLLTTARRYNCQIFATSHNYELLQYLSEVLVDQDFVEFQDDICCYSIVKGPDDKLATAKFTFEKLKFALSHDIEIRGTN